MSNLFRFKLAWIFSKSAFWISIIIIFFGSKGITPADVFFLLSVYNIFMVILEYPTGVIGDYFSHKVSISLGYLLSSLATFVSLFQLPMYGYYIALFISALGIALVSGSDEALLYKLSKDFKKDFSSMTIISMVIGLITIMAGGFLGSININLPVFLDALFYFISFLLMLSVLDISKSTNKKDISSNNIFAFALSGVRYLISTKKLILLFGLNIPLSVLLLSLKWIYNPIFELYDLPEAYWGIAISIFSLITILGAIVYKKIKHFNILIGNLLFIVTLATLSFISSVYLSLFMFAIMVFILKVLDMHYVVEVNSYIKDNMRASLVSLKSLIIRLSSSLYLLFIGYVLGNFSVSYLFVFTALIIVSVWILFLLVFSNKKLFR